MKKANKKTENHFSVAEPQQEKENFSVNSYNLEHLNPPAVFTTS